LLTRNTIKQIFLTALLCTLAIGLHAYQPPAPGPRVQVPAAFAFCGIQLQLSPALQKRVQAEVDRLTANATYFEALTARAAIYMPHVRDAFRHVGTPEDLTYITIQESALRGDAVSTSQAVGFWQLKDYTAEEMGLMVGQGIDERRHISRASLAAARYFFKNNLRFDNWLYSVIAYYEGGGGAQPYVRADYFGARQMYVDETLHWYAIKVLAHKLAFEPALAAHKPTLSLEARSAGSHTSIDKLIADSKLSKEQFLQYNLWVRGSVLPKGRPHTYYIPRAEKVKLDKHTEDPHLAFFEKPAAPVFTFAARAPLKLKPAPPPTQHTSTLVQVPSTERKLDPVKEPWYNRQLTLAEAGEGLHAIAKRTGVPKKKLMKYNDLDAEDEPEAGEVLLLEKPEKVDVHLVSHGETLVGIAERYGKSPEKLKKLNRMTASPTELRPGRKLYLRAARPSNEQILIYEMGSAPAIHMKPTTTVSSTQITTGSVDKDAVNQQLIHKGGISPQKTNTLPTTSTPLTHTSVQTGSVVHQESTAYSTVKLDNPSNTQQMVKTGELPREKPTLISAYSHTANKLPAVTPQANSIPTSNVANSATSALSLPAPALTVQKLGVTGELAVNSPEESVKAVGTEPQKGALPVSSPLKATVAHKNVWVAGTAYIQYTVQKGETLYGIAKQYNMTMDEIKRVNRLSKYAISVGATLLVRKAAGTK